MGNNDKSSNDTEDTSQSEQHRWKATQSLDTGMEIELNNQFNGLVVSHVRPNADGGSIKEITLIDEQNKTYVIQTSNDEQKTPTLILPNNDRVPISLISPENESILATTTARDIYGSKVTDESTVTDKPRPDPDPTPDIDSDELDIIGECPQCDYLVAKEEQRAICTNCGSWSPIEQWNAHYEDKEQHQNPNSHSKTTEGLVQASLMDTWDKKSPQN